MIYSGVLVNISSSVKTVINHFPTFIRATSFCRERTLSNRKLAEGKLMRSEWEFFFLLKLFNLMKYCEILKTMLR